MALNTLAQKGQGGHPILTLKVEQPPEICSQLPGNEQDLLSAEVPAVQRFENSLWAHRNQWDIGRRSLPQDAEGWLHGNGFAGRGRLTKRAADNLLRQAFSALDGEQRPQNSLRHGGAK